VVKKNEYPRKNNFLKDGVQVSEPVNSNSTQKTFEGNTRNNRPLRENQQRDNNQQREYQQRDNQKRENSPRENQPRDNVKRDNTPRENSQRENTIRENPNKDNNQRNFYRDNNVNRENFRDTREPYRQNSQRPAIKPRSEETVEDIAADIGRIEKEIELELREIQSMRLGL